jgi:integral membrane sensor domain MASE1
MRRPLKRPQGPGAQFLWDLLSFERLMTGTVVHLVYWAGLGIIGIIAFGVLGASIGVAIREGGWGILLALGILAIGLLGAGVGVLLWRAFCEFYVTIFKISEDLAVLRKDVEDERGRQGRSSGSSAPLS